MARIAGVDLPREKRVEIGLTYVFGVGRTRSRQTLVTTGINPNIRVRDLDDGQVKQLRDHIEAHYQVEGDLRRDIAQNIKRKVDIGSYQGIRHRRGLPVRGQRTHTNARTRKGRRQAVGGIKKKLRKH
jgi:small subunit ribosomal protein S13